jgi:uncharacterized membrane protein HdeD (DUF308 family)
MIRVLARNWWVLALRGLVAIAFGLAAFALPGVTVAALVLLFGAYALVDGVFAIVAGVRAAERHERWRWMLLEGVGSIVAGVLTFAWPAITAVVLLYLIGFWALVSGILKIASAIHLRRHVPGELVHGLNGVISVLFGLFLLVLPGAGLLAVVWWIAGYSLFRGAMLVVLAWRLRHHARLLGARRTAA